MYGFSKKEKKKKKLKKDKKVLKCIRNKRIKNITKFRLNELSLTQVAATALINSKLTM